MISGVIFDAFGTVLQIGQRTNPYRELIRHGRQQGLNLDSTTFHVAMTTRLSLVDLASHLGISLTSAELKKLNQALELELSSITAFPDALIAMARLKEAGLKIGICSNLASPYVSAVRRLFPHVDGYAFSCELGVMKPNVAIYQSICNQMGVKSGHYFESGTGRVLMIGDSLRCDRDGPRAAGIMGFYLDRSGHGQIHDLLQFADSVTYQNSFGV